MMVLWCAFFFACSFSVRSLDPGRAILRSQGVAMSMMVVVDEDRLVPWARWRHQWIIRSRRSTRDLWRTWMKDLKLGWATNDMQRERLVPVQYLPLSAAWMYINVRLLAPGYGQLFIHALIFVVALLKCSVFLVRRATGFFGLLCSTFLIRTVLSRCTFFDFVQRLQVSNSDPGNIGLSVYTT